MCFYDHPQVFGVFHQQKKYEQVKMVYRTTGFSIEVAKERDDARMRGE